MLGRLESRPYVFFDPEAVNAFLWSAIAAMQVRPATGKKRVS